MGKRKVWTKKKKASLKKKKCCRCNKVLTIDNFYKEKKKYGCNYRSECKQCFGEYNKNSRKLNYDKFLEKERQSYHKKKNTKKYKNSQRNSRYKRLYNITLAQYNTMLASQDNKCAICGNRKSLQGKHLSVDHNHKTGYVRGILCSYCNNRLLKYLKDNKKRAIGLVKYLARAIQNDVGWS